jgi:hypothetical protein
MKLYYLWRRRIDIPFDVYKREIAEDRKLAQPSQEPWPTDAWESLGGS